MREIKFRGRRLDNGEWVYGFYGNGIIDVVDKKEIYKHYIMEWNIPREIGQRGYFADYEVDCRTVGQYIGLKDKNSKEIYEGDIVITEGHRFRIAVEIGAYMLIRLSDDTDMYKLFEDCWNDDVYPLCQRWWNQGDISDDESIYAIEVIGNIYENPELIEGES